MMDDAVLRNGVEKYFDINREMKWAEKFENDECVELMKQVIENLKNYAVQVNGDPRAVLQSCWDKFLHVSIDP